jgi:hypothetical protein
MVTPKTAFPLLLACVFVFSCTNNSTSHLKQNSDNWNSKQLSITATSALKIVENFSEIFKPDSSAYKGIGTLKNIPDSVIEAFKVLRQTDTLSHRKYLTVIFLKLYLDHLRCCHQSYELRDPFSPYIDSMANPMLYEFNFATRMFDFSKPHEFISSSIAETYVQKHKELLMYPQIRQAIDEMKPVEDSINKHLYWKN